MIFPNMKMSTAGYIVIAIVIIVALGGGFYWWYRRTREDTTTTETIATVTTDTTETTETTTETTAESSVTGEDNYFVGLVQASVWLTPWFLTSDGVMKTMFVNNPDSNALFYIWKVPFVTVDNFIVYRVRLSPKGHKNIYIDWDDSIVGGYRFVVGGFEEGFRWVFLDSEALSQTLPKIRSIVHVSESVNLNVTIDQLNDQLSGRAVLTKPPLVDKLKYSTELMWPDSAGIETKIGDMGFVEIQ